MRNFSPQSKYSVYFLCFLFLLTDCTFQKKADEFANAHHNKKIVHYNYRGRPFIAAVGVRAALSNSKSDKELLLYENELAEIMLDEDAMYHINFDIGETVFENKRHDKKFRLVLEPVATDLPEWFSWAAPVSGKDAQVLQLDLDVSKIQQSASGELAFHFYIDDGDDFRVPVQQKIVFKYPYQISRGKNNPSTKKNVLTILTTGVDDFVVPTFSLEGVVKDQLSGLPLENVLLVLSSECPDFEPLLLMSEGDGVFNFPLDVDCCFSVVASKDGYVEHKAKNICTNELKDAHTFTTTLFMGKVENVAANSETENAVVEMPTVSKSVEVEFLPESDNILAANEVGSTKVIETTTYAPTTFSAEIHAAEAPVSSKFLPQGNSKQKQIKSEGTQNTTSVSDSEKQVWELLSANPSVANFRKYVVEYPDGHFIPDAKKMLNSMEFENLISDLKGNFFYQVKDTMTFGEKEVVSMGVAVNELLDKADFLATGKSPNAGMQEMQKEDVAFGLRMKASLIDPAGDKFTISPVVENEEREIDFLNADHVSLWQWNVTPKTEEAGKHRLQFVISKVKSGTNDPVPVKEVDVYVVVEKSFWQQNQRALLLSGLALSGLAMAFFFYKKQKVEKEIRLNLPKEKVYDLIKENKTGAALALLHQYLQNKHRGYYRELLALNARNKAWHEKTSSGVVDAEILTRLKNGINRDVIQFVAKITRAV